MLNSRNRFHIFIVLVSCKTIPKLKWREKINAKKTKFRVKCHRMNWNNHISLIIRVWYTKKHQQQHSVNCKMGIVGLMTCAYGVRARVYIRNTFIMNGHKQITFIPCHLWGSKLLLKCMCGSWLSLLILSSLWWPFLSCNLSMIQLNVSQKWFCRKWFIRQYGFGNYTKKKAQWLHEKLFR